MATRRGTRGGKKKVNKPKPNNTANASGNNAEPGNGNRPGPNENSVVVPADQQPGTTVIISQNNDAQELPFSVKVSNLPPAYNLHELKDHLEGMFNIPILKISAPVKNHPWCLISFPTKEEQVEMVRLLHHQAWKKRILRVVAVDESENGGNELGDSLKRKAEDGDDGPDAKKSKLDEAPAPALTLEEEILAESLPLHDVPYEEQNRLSMLEVEILSKKLHVYMCVRNPDLAGWAEAMCERNGGFIFKIDPLRPAPFLNGYRNKSKFRIGKNPSGEITVGFCINENANKIVSVKPEDKLIHLPDSMKYVAKKFEEYIKTTGKEPHDKKKKSGYWDHIIVRIAPEGDLMLVVIMYHNNQTDEQINEIKKGMVHYFFNGDGKDTNLFSLYFQIMMDKPPVLPSDKLELLVGEPSFEEIICGLKFHVGPYSIINVNTPSAENIYNSIIELAEPKSDTVVLDLCAGTGGIAFTIAEKCEKVIAIESQQDMVTDALQTMKINEIHNVEFIKGKVEEELPKVFERFKDKDVIPIIDPPRQGLVQKAVSLLRANEGIKKLVYVCSNSKMGIKNFLDLCSSSEKKEGTFGNPLNVEFAGLPFLPVKAIPIDVAPFTLNNTIVILFERVDPSTFPPPKNPPPAPIKKPQVKKEDKAKPNQTNKPAAKRLPGVNPKPAGRLNNKNPGNQNAKNRINKPLNRGPNNRGPPMPTNGPKPNFRQGGRGGRFPPPLMGGMDPPMGNPNPLFERRLQEQQDIAFKAGLAMGLLSSRNPGGGGPNLANLANFNPNFQGNAPFPGNYSDFQNQGGFNNRNNSPWQNNQGPGGFNDFQGGNNFGGGGGGGGGSNPFFTRRNNRGNNANGNFNKGQKNKSGGGGGGGGGGNVRPRRM